MKGEYRGARLPALMRREETEEPTPRICSHAPVWVFQVSIALPSDLGAMWRVSGEKATELTGLLWPSSVCRRVPVCTSKILIILSSDLDATRLLSSKKTTELTSDLNAQDPGTYTGAQSERKCYRNRCKTSQSRERLSASALIDEPIDIFSGGQ